MAVQKQDGLHTDVAESAVDLRGKEMRFCKRNAQGKLDVCGAGEYAAGVISEGKEAGKHTSFNTDGNPILRVIAGGALAIDALVSSDAEGRAVTGTANVFGRARKAVSGAGIVAEIIPARIDDAVDNT